MTLAELTLELDKDIKPLTSEEMKTLFERVKQKNLPHINRMRRQMILESTAILLVTAIAIITTLLLAGSFFVSIFFASFATFFAAAEILGFHYYWEAFEGKNLRETHEAFHAKISRITVAMKTINIAFGLALIIIVLVDANVASFVSWPALTVMLVVKVMTWLFALKWIALEKKTRTVLLQFEE